MSNSKIVPFGKYRGRPVEELLADADYVRWCLSQDWFRDKYVTIYQIVTGAGVEPAETPEHNTLQVLFLDYAFCLAFVQHVEPNINEHARKMWHQHLINYATGPLADERSRLWRTSYSLKADEVIAKEAELDARIIAADPRRDDRRRVGL